MIVVNFRHELKHDKAIAEGDIIDNHPNADKGPLNLPLKSLSSVDHCCLCGVHAHQCACLLRAVVH